jgi:hypothetical protein
MVFLAVNQNRHSRVLAPFHAKAGFEIDPVVELPFLDKLLKGLDDVIGSLDMAGTTDADA